MLGRDVFFWDRDVFDVDANRPMAYAESNCDSPGGGEEPRQSWYLRLPCIGPSNLCIFVAQIIGTTLLPEGSEEGGGFWQLRQSNLIALH